MHFLNSFSLYIYIKAIIYLFVVGEAITMVYYRNFEISLDEPMPDTGMINFVGRGQTHMVDQSPSQARTPKDKPSMWIKAPRTCNILTLFKSN